MLKIFFLIFAISPQFSNAKNASIDLSFVDLPPHIHSVKGEPKGSIVDYFNFILKDEPNIKINLSEMPFKRAWFNIKNKKVDGFLTLIETEERKKFVIYLDSDFIEVAPSLCRLKDAKEKEVSRVAIVSETVVPTELKTPKYVLHKVHGSNFSKRSIKLLKNNRVDYIYQPEPLTAIWGLKKHDPQSTISCTSIGKKQKITIGFTRKKNMTQINKIKRFIEKGISYKDFLLKRLKNK